MIIGTTPRETVDKGELIVDRPKQFEKSPESEVWNAIAAFEEILAAIPDDRTALETLYDAYDHIGDKTRALEYLVRLSNQICDERDEGSLPWVFDILHRMAGNDESAAAAIKRIESLADEMGMPSPSDIVPSQGASQKNVDVSSEMSLAWLLMKAEKVSEDEYSMLVSDVTENSTKNIDVPVSILHVMQDRAFTNIPSVMAFMSRDSTLPVIQLTDFDLDRTAYSTLPGEFSYAKGAIAFSQLGKDLLVALLNPYNEELKKEIIEACKRTCHFYLVSAEEYDAYLNRARQPDTATAAAH